VTKANNVQQQYSSEYSKRLNIITTYENLGCAVQSPSYGGGGHSGTVRPNFAVTRKFFLNIW